MLVQQVLFYGEAAQFGVHPPVYAVNVKAEQLRLSLVQLIGQVDRVVALTDPFMLKEKLILLSQGLFLLEVDDLLLGLNLPLFKVKQMGESGLDPDGEFLLGRLDLFFPFLAAYLQFKRLFLVLMP